MAGRLTREDVTAPVQLATAGAVRVTREDVTAPVQLATAGAVRVTRIDLTVIVGNPPASGGLMQMGVGS